MSSTTPTPSARSALLEAARAELVEKGHASVSLRAVARRAGVSHAAPAYFFRDRAGMLTAVATEGFQILAASLARAAEAPEPGSSRLAAMGSAYVDFGLEHPALIDLMFRRSELSPENSELLEAQRHALGLLREAVDEREVSPADGWSLVSWAFVHGLVTLVREGVLAPIAGRDVKDGPDLARDLVVLYAAQISRSVSD